MKRGLVRTLWDDFQTGVTVLSAFNWETKKETTAHVTLEKGDCGWMHCDEVDGSVKTICSYNYAPLDATLVSIDTTSGNGTDVLQWGGQSPVDWAGAAHYWDKASRSLIFNWPQQIKTPPFTGDVLVMNQTAKTITALPFVGFDGSILPSQIAYSDSTPGVFYAVNISAGPPDAPAPVALPEPVCDGCWTTGATRWFRPHRVLRPEFTVWRQLVKWTMSNNRREQIGEWHSTQWDFYSAGGQVHNSELQEWANWADQAFKTANLTSWHISTGNFSSSDEVAHHTYPLTFWEWVVA